MLVIKTTDSRLWIIGDSTSIEFLESSDGWDILAYTPDGEVAELATDLQSRELAEAVMNTLFETINHNDKTCHIAINMSKIIDREKKDMAKKKGRA